MSMIDVVEREIDALIQDFTKERDSIDNPLDKSYYDCSIGTLKHLKKKIGLD